MAIRKKQSLNNAIPIFSRKWQLFYVYHASEQSVLVKKEKEEFRAVIKHFYLKKWVAAQIKAELDEVHMDTAPMLKTVYFWIHEFKRGRTSTKDEVRPGRSVKANAAQKMIGKIHRIVMEDRRIEVREIAEIFGMHKKS